MVVLHLLHPCAACLLEHSKRAYRSDVVGYIVEPVVLSGDHVSKVGGRGWKGRSGLTLGGLFGA